jgi:hypothetical protein
LLRGGTGFATSGGQSRRSFGSGAGVVGGFGCANAAGTESAIAAKVIASFSNRMIFLHSLNGKTSTTMRLFRSCAARAHNGRSPLYILRCAYRLRSAVAPLLGLPFCPDGLLRIRSKLAVHPAPQRRLFSRDGKRSASVQRIRTWPSVQRDEFRLCTSIVSDMPSHAEGRTETRTMDKAKRARTAETPKQPTVA